MEKPSTVYVYTNFNLTWFPFRKISGFVTWIQQSYAYYQVDSNLENPLAIPSFGYYVNIYLTQFLFYLGFVDNEKNMILSKLYQSLHKTTFLDNNVTGKPILLWLYI
jgi:hypothetical protein